MRVMLLESDRRTATETVQALEQAGHEVFRCHDADEQAWPCNGLRDDRTCPLDEGVDVVLTVRAHPYPRPTAFEDGVACAVRKHVPLVVAGSTILCPFAGWVAAECAPDDVVETVERAARAPLPRHGAAALDAIRQVLVTHGHDPEGASVEVLRERKRLEVRVDPGIVADKKLADVLAVRVAQAIRVVDQDSQMVNVTVARPAEVAVL